MRWVEIVGAHFEIDEVADYVLGRGEGVLDDLPTVKEDVALDLGFGGGGEVEDAELEVVEKMGKQWLAFNLVPHELRVNTFLLFPPRLPFPPRPLLHLPLYDIS